MATLEHTDSGEECEDSTRSYQTYITTLCIPGFILSLLQEIKQNDEIRLKYQPLLILETIFMVQKLTLKQKFWQK